MRVFSFFVLFLAPIVFLKAQAKPSDIPGLALWLRSDSGTVLSGDTLIQWNDVSGNGNSFGQAMPSHRPLYSDSATRLDFKPAVRFDGSDDNLLSSIPVRIGTIFMVSNWRGGAGTFPGYNGLINESNSNHFPHYILIGSAGTHDFWNTNTLLNSISINSNTSLSYSPLVNYKVLSAYSVDNSLAYDLVLGNNPFDSGNNYWNGDIAEIIVYDTSLTAGQCQQVEQYLYLKYAPPVNLGPDITMNSLCDTTLDAGSRFVQYKWNGSNSDTSQMFTVSSSGKYFVQVRDIFGHVSSDTVNVTYPFNQIAHSNSICKGDTLVWDSGFDPSFYKFQWSNGVTTAAVRITQSGTYSVAVTGISSGCVFLSDTVHVTVDNFPVIATLGKDTALCSGANIGLMAGANQATSYLWSTGQTTSTIVINSSGFYSVIAKNANGCTAKDTVKINVKGTAPVASFSVALACPREAASFTDHSTPVGMDSISSWSWDFGDGSPMNASQNPTHSYTAAGTYPVRLTVITDSGCANFIQKPVVVNKKPAVSFTNTTPCSAGNTIFLDGSTIVNDTLAAWNWNFGDPSSGSKNFSSTKNASHVFGSVGTYPVQLVVGTIKGCKDTLVRSITVMPSPSASFSCTTVCVGNTTFFSSNPGYAYQWVFGDGYNSPFQNPSHQYAAAGSYSVTLTVNASSGCSDRDTGLAIVNPRPGVGFTESSPLCMRNPVQFTDTTAGAAIASWKWSFGQGDTSSQQNPAMTYTAAGTYSVSLNVSTAKTCTASATHTVSVHPLPKPGFTSSADFGAAPLVVSFTNSSTGAIFYQWDFGDGSQNLVANPTHTYKDTGVYFVRLIAQNQFGCLDSAATDTIRVVPPLLDVAITSATGLQQGNNTVKVYALLYNSGTITDTSIELSARLDGGNAIHETWKGKLKSKSAVTYMFASSFELNPGQPHHVVCAEVRLVNGKEDEVFSNNSQCDALTGEFTLLDPYPNPASDEVYFLFISPEESGAIAQIYDLQGRLLENVFQGTAAKGLNEISYNTYKLDKGAYLLRLSSNGRQAVKIFLKQ